MSESNRAPSWNTIAIIAPDREQLVLGESVEPLAIGVNFAGVRDGTEAQFDVAQQHGFALATSA